MTDPMIVDAQASAITGWAGPVPFSVDLQATVTQLKRYYNVDAVLGQRTVAGIKFLHVSFKSQDDLASAMNKPSTFFHGQFIHAMTDVKEWLNQPADQAKNVQILCAYNTIRQLPGLLAKGHALLVDNCCARLFSRVLWRYESKEDADAAAGLGEYALTGHDLRFCPGTARLCFSCGSLDHLRNACPTRPQVKILPPSFLLPAPAPASAGGVSYADAAKQALNKVDSVEKDLHAEVAYLADQVNDMKEQLAKFCARQDELLAALKLAQDKVAKQVEELDTRQESLASTVKGLSASLETLDTELDAESEMVAKLMAHKARMSERYMRVNHDLAIVEVNLKVALDELRLYDDFEECLAAAREKSWAHYAKKQGSIAYPDSFLSKS
ncbi:hypothetical protein BCR44DRAFT_53475 [Catenaria anguillulae PL171]|uniref:CCHC-type domain-containing protein n=1 Tax=Catenaria anguillulae PL171 TaxID=765915 RepID=A0A1Y2H599_9FUNG|nr:hypothetical protein BCR44DRAFT_53475 [Catenaria anguillulae PL171]